MNAITLHRMKFFAHHGVCPQEQVVGNRFEVTLQVFCDMEKAMTGAMALMHFKSYVTLLMRQVYRSQQG